MKTFLKFAAIAAIMALMVISCSPPDIPQAHYEWWDQYNEQFDAKQNTLDAYPYSFNFTDVKLLIGDKVENSVKIIIQDENADIFKEDKPEAKLKEFLSFYTFIPTEQFTSAELQAGKPHALVPLSGSWSLDRKSGSDGFILKMPASFTASSSNLVWKIDGSKYTFSGGNKMDRDGNGVPGEAFYDDVYGYLTVSGITNTATPRLPSTGTDTSFTVSLSQTFPARTFSIATSTETTATTMVIMRASDITESFLTATDKDDLLKLLVGGIKVEKFAESEGKWSPAFSASFDSTNHRINIEDFKATHMTGYRVVFEKGSIKLETAKEYYGVKQRIIVNLGVDNVSEDKTSIKRIEGNPSDLYYNSRIRDFFDLQETFIDYPGTVTTTTTYTHSWTWSPAWVKEQKLMTTEPNPDYDAEAHKTAVEADDGETSEDDKIHEATYLASHSIVLTIPATFVDIDDADYIAYMWFDKTDGAEGTIKRRYPEFHACNPLIKPTYTDSRSPVINDNSNYNPTQPSISTNAYYNSDSSSGWIWGSNQVATVSSPSSTATTPDFGSRDRFKTELSSVDKNDQNIVLRLEIGPNSVKGSDNITTRYYAKKLDLDTFKNNFKIYYSASGDSSPTTAEDVIEIGIEKVDFKTERTTSYSPTNDTFVDTIAAPFIKYSGFNVIYITLDPNYKKNTKTKELYIGSGFGYSDGINVFSSTEIWSNKGFKAYNVGDSIF